MFIRIIYLAAISQRSSLVPSVLLFIVPYLETGEASTWYPITRVYEKLKLDLNEQSECLYCWAIYVWLMTYIQKIFITPLWALHTQVWTAKSYVFDEKEGPQFGQNLRKHDPKLYQRLLHGLKTPGSIYCQEICELCAAPRTKWSGPLGCIREASTHTSFTSFSWFQYVSKEHTCLEHNPIFLCWCYFSQDLWKVSMLEDIATTLWCQKLNWLNL